MSGSPNNPRVALHTLGCKLNYAETSTLAKQFADRGFTQVPLDAEMDVLVLNTCSVTENAEKECRQLIRRALRKSPNAFVAVTGCYAQLRPQEIAAIEGVDLVLGSGDKFGLFTAEQDFRKLSQPRVVVRERAELVEFHSAATSESDSRTRAFLKVQDGCDYSCSYCTIPEARGKSRSDTVDSVVAEARGLSEEGFREIVLSGVNVGDFGAGTPETFMDLARTLNADPDVTARLRISSIEPNLLTSEIIELVAASDKWCPHFHIPLQSGSPKMLRLMQRRYNRDDYASKVEAIRLAMPYACIGADVIVGFPGETDDNFAETLLYLTDLEINYMHVFTYSERPGTKAAGMTGVVPMDERRDRNRLLRNLSDRKLAEFYRSQLGSERTAIIEHTVRDGFAFGYTENYVRVSVPIAETIDAQLVRVSLDEMRSGAVNCSVLEVLSRREDCALVPILC